jgi:hypothetical protein
MDLNKVFSMSANARTVARIGDQIRKRIEMDRKEVVARMNLAVNIVYKTASAKRPMIGTKGHRVSDPASPFGVPVAEKGGGRLKAAIQKEVTVGQTGVTGRIWIDPKKVPYARRIEYGFMNKRDSKGRMYHQAPRPFMRPAWNLNKQTVDAVLHKPMKKR